MLGHIRKRGTNSWAIVVDVGPDPATGGRRRKWISVKGSRKDAERKQAEVLAQLYGGSFVSPSRVTVGSFLHQWLDQVRPRVRPKTFEGYRSIVERHLIPGLGSILLTQLQTAQVDAYYAQAMTAPRLDGHPGTVSASTVGHHHRVLVQALNTALRQGLVARDVAAVASPPRPEHREMRTLTGRELVQLLDGARGTPYYALVYTAAFTGMRRSELLGLRWRAVDLENGSLAVVLTLHQLAGGRYDFQEPKTQ